MAKDAAMAAEEVARTAVRLRALVATLESTASERQFLLGAATALEGVAQAAGNR